jgi:solute carrier family 8 (sodium/calcium exchanger)
VKYDTRDGTASAGDDYLASNGVLEFAAGEVTKDIQVTLIDDNQWEPDETFDIVLSDPEKQPDGSKGIFLSEPSVSTITIINDDEPGVLEFAEHRYQVAESEGALVVTVKRKNGSDGTVTCKYNTQDHSDKSALEGVDYDAVEGTLVFDNAEIEKTFKVKIINSGKYQRDERFQIRLCDATGGATFSADTDGSIEQETCVVTIVHDVGNAKTVDHISKALNINVDRLKLGSANWYEQFTDALQVNGGEESDEPPSTADWVGHVTSLPWKLLFATCPPTDFAGGWACFVVSLSMIGGVTVIIGDAAAIFGCLFGLKDSVTAITFVALGTSLPDTFASMTAAKQDPYADASIGNITGSNSVNVFLGLGLPWVIATLYWAGINGANGGPTDEWKAKYKGIISDDALQAGGFAVPAGALGFSVGVFCTCACCCFAILNFRRRSVGGELGGPKRLQNITAAALVFLWFMYVLLSSLKAYAVI